MLPELDGVNAPNGTYSVHVGQRLRELRGKRSQSEFAEQLRIGLSTYRRYESGERLPDAEVLIRLKTLEKCSTDWLLSAPDGGSDSPSDEPFGRDYHLSSEDVAFGAERLRPADFLIEVEIGEARYQINPDDYCWVPFYDVEFGAGGGRVVEFGRPPKKFNAWRKDYLRERGLIGADLFEATVVGTSMWPEIHDRDTILINASDKEIRSGGIYGVDIGGEFICKYVRRLPGGLIEIASENSKLHPPITIRESELGDGVSIVGSVLRNGRDR